MNGGGPPGPPGIPGKDGQKVRNHVLFYSSKKYIFGAQHTTKILLVASAVVTGGPGGRAPPVRFTQNTFLEHHATTRQQTIMEKGITFKHNSCLKFSRFFAKLLATNCCT